MLSALVSPAGGLRYHLRAWRYSRSRWAPFRVNLASWLDRWPNRGRRLALIGPSGGYSLTGEFLSRFESIIGFEPDPVARWLFARRFAGLGLSIEWIGSDHLIEPLLAGTRGFDDWLRANGDVDVCFSNVLGQVRFLTGDTRFSAWADAFQRRILGTLESHAWVSYHDRLSGYAAIEAGRLETLETCLSSEELAARATADSEARIDFFDHLTANLFPSGWARRYFDWELEPGHHFLIEGIQREPVFR